MTVFHRIILLFFLSSCLFTPVRGASQIDPYERALQPLIDQGDEAGFLEELEEILTELEAADQYFQWLALQRSMADRWIKQGEPFLAIRCLERGVNQPYRHPSNDCELDTYGWFLIFTGQTYGYRAGQFQESTAYFEAAQEILSNCLQQKNEEIVIQLYNRLGNIYTRLGDLERSIHYLQVAKDLCLELNLTNTLARVWTSIGITYSTMGAYQKALDSYQEGLKVPDLLPRNEASLYINKAYDYFNLKQYEEAEKCVRQTEAILPRIENPGYRDARLADLQTISSRVYTELKKWEQAEDIYRQLIVRERRQNDGQPNRGLGKILVSYSEFHRSQGKTEAAIQTAQEALTAVLPTWTPTNLFELPPDSLFFAENTLIEGFQALGLAWEARAEATDSTAFYEQAIAAYQQGLMVPDLLRAAYLDATSEIRLLETTRALQECQFRCYFGLQAAPEALFQICEQSKGILLLETLKESRADEFADIPAAMLEAEGQLKHQLYLSEQRYKKLNKPEQDTLAKNLEKKIFDLQEQLKLLRQQLNETASYKVLSEGWEIPSVSDVQPYLQAGQGLLEFFQSGETWYVFYLDRQSCLIEPLGVLPDLQEDVQALLDAVYQYGDYPNKDRVDLAYHQTFAQLSHSLYQQLIEPIEKRVELPSTLIIAPDGMLNYLPFEVLLATAPDRPGDYPSYDYLLKHYQISYGFSAALMIEFWTRTTKPTYDFLGIAPKFSASNFLNQQADSRHIFLPLDHNEEEVDRIAGRFKRPKVLKRQAANLDNFVKLAGLYRIIHMATHGKADLETGEESLIAFSAGEDGESEFLFAGDLYAFSLNAELVVMSACETGRGSLSRGEGVIGLARAFASAGAQAMITTLWTVNDKVTAQLMPDFYDQMDLGLPKDQALRQVKTAYLEKMAMENNTARAHPYYWAPYTPMGNMKPLYRRHPARDWLAAGSIFFAVVDWLF